METECFVADAESVRKHLRIPKRIRVFDTTLRDGEQTPGIVLSLEQKLRLAQALDEIGVEVIEAGFPAASEGESELFRKISGNGMKARLCGLARANEKDIDACVDAGADYVHTFIATSELHMKFKLKKTREQVLELAVKAVEHAKQRGVQVEFSAEDATRSEEDFLLDVYKQVEKAGACTLNVPDTVGASVPSLFYPLVRKVVSQSKATVSVHCHNDFGLATANTLAGVEAGATQVHATVNGYGERGGNAALEEVVGSLEFIYKIKTGVETRKLHEISQLFARETKLWPQPNKAITGENAFAHEAGIHVHGMAAHALTYEPIAPELVGQKRRIVFGKLTGKHAVETRIKEMGFRVSEEELEKITEKIKAMGDKGKRVRDPELVAIVEDALGQAKKQSVVLEQALVTTGNKIIPTSSVRVKINGRTVDAADTGVGPVAAALNALQKASGEFAHVRLKEYKLEAISGGSDAVCEVTVLLEDEKGNEAVGTAVGPDIIMTSIEAMVSGLNRMVGA